MHPLRLFFALTLLAQGVSIKKVAEYLDPSDPGFTLRTCTSCPPATNWLAGRSRASSAQGRLTAWTRLTTEIRSRRPGTEFVDQPLSRARAITMRWIWLVPS